MRSLLAALLFIPTLAGAQSEPRARARDLGVAPGIFATGRWNAITDVAGVRVGQTTLVGGDSVHTGVTAIFPSAENPFRSRVPAAIVVGNGFGKLLGSTQVNELGELESPILLTCTLCVWRVGDALAGWMLEQPDMGDVRSINVVVGETNDGQLNAIRSRPVGADAVRSALIGATSGPVAEGSVGAGTGTVAFGFKGGIGTSSRVLPSSLGGYAVGVLVQSNFGGVLQILGAPVGKALGTYAFRDAVEREKGDGSIMIVVATDAPLSDRNLRRLAERALMGLARTGSSASNGSGDYVVAFSTAASVRRVQPAGAAAPRGPATLTTTELANDETSALYQAVVEATEEAIYNSLFMATTTTARGRTVRALPLDSVRAILRRYNATTR
ncbi:MAG TPA: P1 family peptidase [Gemmatimonadaceae bacterium]